MKTQALLQKDIAIKVIVAYDTTNFGTLQILRKK